MPSRELIAPGVLKTFLSLLNFVPTTFISSSSIIFSLVSLRLDSVTLEFLSCDCFSLDSIFGNFILESIIDSAIFIESVLDFTLDSALDSKSVGFPPPPVCIHLQTLH